VAPPPTYRFAVNPPWGDLSRTSAVVRSGLSGDYHADPFETTLSLKSVSQGVASYATPRTRYRVDAASVVVLNQGQTYTLDIDAGDRTSTMAVFFEPGLVEDVARALSAGPGALLEPRADAAPGLSICERLHPKAGGLARRLGDLDLHLRAGTRDAAWIEDQVLALAAEIVLLDGRARREMARLPGLRPATREEAYRRLYWARDFIDASFAEPLTVARLARVACLSPFHFQRLFKQAFGETPMQRVQEQRLARAARLLADTDRDVTWICHEVGFESLGSFSALFRRRLGASPRAFRQMRRTGEMRRRARR
jgi:AraC family transcriptional regulator